MFTRCEWALPSPRAPCSGDHFEHAQRQRRGLVHNALHSVVGALWKRRLDAAETL